MKKKYLVTGCAGFIGFHVVKKLLSNKNLVVIGIDSLNQYYDPKLKLKRLKELKNISTKKNFKFYKINLINRNKLKLLFKKFNFDKVIHLAAQPGVRYSLKNPNAYIQNNIVAFANLIEICSSKRISHFIYASSSSVYGANHKMPFKETDRVDTPLQLYAATKKSNELIAFTYSNIYKMPTTGLRFFTVYGPWGRPDMALFLFTKNIILKKPINLFNYGRNVRDFTYIDDIVKGVIKIINKIPVDISYKKKNSIPYRIVNIGSSKKIKVTDYVNEIERSLKKKAKKILLPSQKGDMLETLSDTSLMNRLVNYKSTTKIKIGIKNFTEWFVKYYKYK
jgi:UDP-glucuronate 4-epimerase